MFERVLIAEDHHSVNSWVKQTLYALQTAEIKQAHYCDDAYNLLKIAVSEENPFDLLITDLSFREDRQEQTLRSGRELIRAARQLQPELRVLVFSGENQPAVIRTLYEQLGINGYVAKGPRDEEDMKKGIEADCRSQNLRPGRISASCSSQECT